MFAKLNNGQLQKYPYTLGMLRKDNANISFPKVLDDATLAQFELVKVSPTPRPEYDHTKDFNVTAELVNGSWVEVWIATDATPEEIAQRLKDMVPAEVTMRQARLALFAQGILSQVDAALAAIPDETERTKAQIEWEYATVVERNAQLTLALGAAMGLTEDQLDQLFIFAGTL